jgi:hypothetical protein
MQRNRESKSASSSYAKLDSKEIELEVKLEIKTFPIDVYSKDTLDLMISFLPSKEVLPKFFLINKLIFVEFFELVSKKIELSENANGDRQHIPASLRISLTDEMANAIAAFFAADERDSKRISRSMIEYVARRNTPLQALAREIIRNPSVRNQELRSIMDVHCTQIAEARPSMVANRIVFFSGALTAGSILFFICIAITALVQLTGAYAPGDPKKMAIVAALMFGASLIAPLTRYIEGEWNRFSARDLVIHSREIENLTRSRLRFMPQVRVAIEEKMPKALILKNEHFAQKFTTT